MPMIPALVLVCCTLYVISYPSAYEYTILSEMHIMLTYQSYSMLCMLLHATVDCHKILLAYMRR